MKVDNLLKERDAIHAAFTTVRSVTVASGSGGIKVPSGGEPIQESPNVDAMKPKWTFPKWSRSEKKG